MDSHVDADVTRGPFSHIWKLEDHGGGRSINLPVNKEDKVRERLKFVVQILRCLVRSTLEWAYDHQELRQCSEQVEDLIQKVVREIELPAADMRQRVFPSLKIIAEGMEHILSVCDQISESFSGGKWKGPENTIRFIDSLTQILHDIYDDHPGIIAIFIFLKKQILDIHEELKFLGDFFWLTVVNPLTRTFSISVTLSYHTEHIAVTISRLLCKCLVNDKLDDTQLIQDLKQKLCHVQLDVRNHYLEKRGSFLPGGDTSYAANMMNERVVGFFDYLIGKLRELLSRNAASFMVDAGLKDEIEILVDELSFLRCDLLDIIELYLKEEEDDTVVKEMKYLYVSTQNLIMETGFLVRFSPPDDNGENEKERTNYWIFHLPDLFGSVDSVKRQASDICDSRNKYSFCRDSSSRLNEMEYINFLIKNLEELMHSEVNSIHPLKHQIQKIYQDTVSIRKCLLECDQLMKSQSRVGQLVARFEEAAYQSYYMVDSLLAGQGPLWFKKLGMFVVANDMKILHREMKGFLKERITFDAVGYSFSNPTSSPPSIPVKINSTVGSRNEIKDTRMDKFVGMKDAVLELIELLTGNAATRLNIVSIVGMPGLGKTTLANSIYKHPSVIHHFHVRAWCCASQTYEKKALLLEILSQLIGETNQNKEAGNDRNEFFALRLYQNLKGRKFLIVIDDVWDLNLWNDLRETFPDDHNGSRILFTTRNRAVALAAKSFPYDLRLLSSEESCKLLLSKVFGHETCPLEVSAILRCIARNCKGLPLAVVLFAGILKRTDRRKDSWVQVYETAKGLWRTHAKDTDIMNFTNILELSYDSLPHFLKPCFLYFGGFPQGSSIPVSKLIRLWISEGFMKGVDFGLKSLEHEAEHYLNELIDRSLVMTAGRSSSGGVKTCRIHDVLREFCSAKLDSQEFVLTEAMFRRNLSNPGLDMQFRTFLYDHRFYPTTVFGQFHSSEIHAIVPFKPRTEAYSEKDVFRYNPSSVRDGQSEGTAAGTRINQSANLGYRLIFKYQQLTVLDLGTVGVEGSADTSDLVMISKLVHLTYLAIRPRGNEIPTEMGNLRKLETFALSGVIGNILLPESVWNLTSLRHLLTDHGFFDFEHCSKLFFEEFSQMYNLKSLSFLPLSRGSDVEKFILRRLPKIEKLGCRFFTNSRKYLAGPSIFPELDFLSELKSLKIFFSGRVHCPCKFSFPSNLTKLAMSNSRLPWKEISVIGRLPNLKVLKLLNKAFEGRQWDVNDGEFPNLKFLKLESLDIKKWEAFAPDHLPILEQLVVQHCPLLEKVPSSFGEIATLKLIEMKWCSSFAMDSVKEILEFQRDMSNDELSVTLVGGLL